LLNEAVVILVGFKFTPDRQSTLSQKGQVYLASPTNDKLSFFKFFISKFDMLIFGRHVWFSCPKPSLWSKLNTTSKITEMLIDSRVNLSETKLTLSN